MVIRQMMVVALVAGATSFASAQPADAPQVPSKPDQRTWYPRTDVYFPEKIVGSWVRFNNQTLEFIALEKYPNGVTPKPTLLGSIPAYTLNATKGTEAKAGIPGFASVELKENEVQSFAIVDVATVSVGEGASELFCRDWGKLLKNARDWKPGDELRYINSVLLSHVSWKIGTEHAKGADVGIEGIFNAGGKQYDQTSVQALLPGVSFITTVKEIKADDLAGKSCAGVKPRGWKSNTPIALDFKPNSFSVVVGAPAKQ